MSQFYYIRHGQASYGADNYDQLSDLGYRQSYILGQYFLSKSIEIHHIYVGPLVRHRQTFEKFREAFTTKGNHLPTPQIVDELDEHKGPSILKRALPYLLKTDTQIREWNQLMASNPESKSRYGLLIFDRAMELWACGQLEKHQPPEYDTWFEFRKTVSEGFEKMFTKHSKYRGQNILLFTSGGTISAVLGKLMDIPCDIKVIQLNGVVQNASFSEVLFNQDKYTLKSFNKVPHLTEEMITYV